MLTALDDKTTAADSATKTGDDDVIIVGKEEGEKAMETTTETPTPAPAAAEVKNKDGQEVFKVMDSVGEVDEVIPVIDSGEWMRSAGGILSFIAH